MLAVYVNERLDLWYFDVARRLTLCLGPYLATKHPQLLAETVFSGRLGIALEFTRRRGPECKLLVDDLAVRIADFPALLVEAHPEGLGARDLPDHVLQRGLHPARRGRGHQHRADQFTLAAVALSLLDRPGGLPDRQRQHGLNGGGLPVAAEHDLKISRSIGPIIEPGKKTSPPEYRENMCCCASN